MTESTRVMFEQVLNEIDKSHADADLKDQTKGLVFQVMKLNNGSSNEITDIKDSMTFMAVFLIRHTMRNSPSEFESKASSSKLGTFILAIRPVAWPLSVFLTVSLFSSHFTEIVNLLKSLIH